MTYFMIDGHVFSYLMTEYGLAVYDLNGIEIFDMLIVEQAYQDYDSQRAA